MERFQVMMIFWFTGLAVAAVGKTAGEVVREVRRQFKENPGIMEYKQKPDYRACVSLVTEVGSTKRRRQTHFGAGRNINLSAPYADCALCICFVGVSWRFSCTNRASRLHSFWKERRPTALESLMG